MSINLYIIIIRWIKYMKSHDQRAGLNKLSGETDDTHRY